MTLREDVWDEALTLLVQHGKFRISELSTLQGDEGKRTTIRRALRQMEDKGWVRRSSPQSPIWRIGWKAEMLLALDEETIEASKNE